MIPDLLRSLIALIGQAVDVVSEDAFGLGKLFPKFLPDRFAQLSSSRGL